MSVNTMEFKDAAAILNNIRKQVTGETAIAPANTAEFVSVATTLLQAGYDPVLNAITQMVSRTIFSIRPYNRKFAGIKMDEEKASACHSSQSSSLHWDSGLVSIARLKKLQRNIWTAPEAVPLFSPKASSLAPAVFPSAGEA